MLRFFLDGLNNLHKFTFQLLIKYRHPSSSTVLELHEIANRIVKKCNNDTRITQRSNLYGFRVSNNTVSNNTEPTNRVIQGKHYLNQYASFKNQRNLLY